MIKSSTSTETPNKEFSGSVEERKSDVNKNSSLSNWLPKMQEFADTNSRVFLVSAWKLLKSKIEEEYKIESKLEKDYAITKDMEYYAQVYEIEHCLKDSNQTADFGDLSKTLDSIAKDLNIKSNLETQLIHWLQEHQIEHGVENVSKVIYFSSISTHE